MKRLAVLFAISTLCAFCMNKNPDTQLAGNAVTNKSIYDFTIESIDGETIRFADYKGKMILIVNTASKCGYTPQYKALQELYNSHKDKLVIVGFPSDNFGGQEYQDNQDIKAFCEKNFGVTFPLTTRVDVKGDNTTPVYKYLCNKSENGVLDAEISWNFNKFLIDANGNLVKHFSSKVKPDSEEILAFLK